MTDSEPLSEQAAYNRCITLLSRREHSVRELRQKMSQHGVNNAVIDCVIARLIDDNYQSDGRFAEVFCRSRVARKYGPKKIRYELKQKGIDDRTINAELSKYDDDFLENAKSLIVRKLPRGNVGALRDDLKLKDKINRALANKGYDFDMIRLAFSALREQEDDFL